MNESVQTVLKIDPQQAQRAIALLMKAKIPPVLVGPVGCGKTSAVKDFTKKLNLKGVEANLITKVLAQLDISNFSLPKEVKERIHEICAEWIPLESDETGDDPYSIIFFDELDRCDQMVQNIILNIILDRQIASKKISDKVIFVGAMNGSSDIYTTPLSAAAVNRVCMLYIHSTNDSYDSWAEENGISDGRRAFQRFKSDIIVGNEEQFEDVSFPTNRSLDFVDRVDQIITSIKENPDSVLKTSDIYAPIVAGLIGVPASTEWIQFKQLYDIAETPDVILADVNAAKIDYDPSIKFAVLTNVVNYAKENLDLCELAFQFAARFEPEYTVAFSNLILEKAPESCTCPTYVKLHKTMGI
jgi:hypothetical protein